MKFGRGIIALVAAFMLLAGSGAAALAQEQLDDTGNATVNIISNVTDNFLAVAITDAPFTDRPYSFVDQDTIGSLTVTATDTRGTASGWSVTLSASDFERDLSTSFDISNLSLAVGIGSLNGVLFNGATALTTGLTANSVTPVQETGAVGGPSTILSAVAGSGAGQFALVMDGTLTIPGGTLVGTYQSTVTVEISSAP